MQQNRKFDKNSIIGFALLLLIFVGFMLYSNYNAPEPKNNSEAQKTTEQSKPTTQPSKQTPTVSLDSATNVTEKIVPLQSKKLSLQFTNKGAQLKQVELLQYKTYDKNTNKHSKPLYLINNSADFNFEIKTTQGKVYNTKDLLFQEKIQEKAVTFTTALEGGILQIIYTLKKDYELGFEVKTQNLTTADNTAIEWNFKAFQLEKGRTQEASFTDIHYAYDNYDETDYNSSKELDQPDETLNWICAKQQFFLSIIEAEKGFTQSHGSVKTIDLEKEKDSTFLKTFHFTAKVKNGNQLNEKFTWYFLPMDLEVLNQYEKKRFDDLIPFDYMRSGFIGWINKHFFYNIYKWLSELGVSAGIAILLMTIIMKLLLFPLMFKQHKQSAMMRALKPELDELNEKNKDKDALVKQQATMDLYRKAGVNPLSGCVPALIQLPLFMALFRLFPNIIQMRGESFLWADDLTSYDSVAEWTTHIPLLSSFYGNHVSLFALLYTVVLIIYTRMTANNIQQPTQEGMPDMKFIMYLMPVFMLVFLNSYASGLSWYYVVSNVINILMILFIRQFMIDEKKLHAQIQDNKKKPAKKKGKLAQLLEQAAEQQKLQQQKKK